MATVLAGSLDIRRDSTVDVFTNAGQSNAVGRGTAGRSPRVDRWKGSYVRGDDFHVVEYPVRNIRPWASTDQYNAATGSAWPQFVDSYASLTGRPVILVQTAVGGSGLHPKTRLDELVWGPGGYLTPSSITFTREVLNLLATRPSLRAEYRGVLWHQGERDASAISTGELTLNAYRQALVGTIGRFNRNLPHDGRFYIFTLGSKVGVAGDPFAPVRELQRDLSKTRENVILVSDVQHTFPDIGFMQDSVHYDQRGYNLMGETAAKTLAARR